MVELERPEIALQKLPACTLARLSPWRPLNEAILAGFEAAKDQPDRQSHFFHGRFENIYIDAGRIPALAFLFDCALKVAAELLGRPRGSLKYGFWFNLMQPGHVTTRHNHDEDDELLSCVYYLDVPENSGNLLLDVGARDAIIQPEAGLFVFFDPARAHAVTENLSERPRLSLAMNFGPAASS